MTINYQTSVHDHTSLLRGGRLVATGSAEPSPMSLFWWDGFILRYNDGGTYKPTSRSEMVFFADETETDI